jgi:hypothetical protein
MPIGIGALLLAIGGWTALTRRPRSLRLARVAPIALLSGLFLIACGSNGTSPPPATTPAPTPTPTSSPGPATVASGTYAITVTGTSGSSQHAAVVTLTVH